MKPSEKRRSLARSDPFLAVKLELGVVLLVCLLALFVSIGLDRPAWQEVLGLAAVGVGSAAWLGWRTRRLVADWRRQEGEVRGEDQEQ